MNLTFMAIALWKWDQTASSEGNKFKTVSKTDVLVSTEFNLFKAFKRIEN